MKLENSFTLIELLVVISIIGLLGSIVLASLGGAKDQADIAKAQQFSHTVRVSLGDKLVGEWRFDDGTAIDSSGYDNNGTINGAPSEDDGIFGKALKFNGTGDNIVVPVSSILTKAALAYTVEVWIKPEVDNDYWTGVVGKAGRNYNFWLGQSNDPDGGYVHHRFHTTASTNDNCPNAYLIPMNEWSHVVLTNDGSTCKTYINSETKAQRTFAATLISDSTSLNIGRSLDGNNSNYFKGIIDEVRIYEKALASAEIEQLYAEGAAKHGIVLK